VADQNKLESFFKDLLTLEVTTVVVDEIPPEVVLDVKRQVAVTGRRMWTQMAASTTTAGATAAGAAMAGPEAGAVAENGKPPQSTPPQPTPPQPTPPSSLKDMLDAVARHGARAKADLEQKLHSAKTNQEAALAMSPADAEVAQNEAAESARRGERASVLLALLPQDDAEDMDTLPEERRVALRRVATLANYPIALHTTISVSGDLTTLCAREHAGPSGAAVRALHAEGVANAIGWWRVLADSIAGFLKNVLDAIGTARSAKG
jgi:hypothetical protein